MFLTSHVQSPSWRNSLSSDCRPTKPGTLAAVVTLKGCGEVEPESRLCPDDWPPPEDQQTRSQVY